MTPAEFFETVTRPNLKMAIEEDDDYRLVVNAILTADAFYGILFEHLKDAGHPVIETVSFNGSSRTDSDFKEHFAQQSAEWSIVRDAAYATKHGRLSDTRKKVRLVRSAHDVSGKKLVAGLFAAGDRLGASAIFIQSTDGKLHRAWYLLRRVEMFTEDLLIDLGMPTAETTSP